LDPGAKGDIGAEKRADVQRDFVGHAQQKKRASAAVSFALFMRSRLRFFLSDSVPPNS
jgi:hypothetical protein